MTEVSKVFTGLDCCIDSDIVGDDTFCNRCPYSKDFGCRNILMREARELLKTFNPQKIQPRKVVCIPLLCPECGEPILHGWKHCAHCGAKLEEGEA